MKSILIKNKFKNGEWKKNPEKVDISNWKKYNFRYADYIKIELDDSTILENEGAQGYLLAILNKEAREKADKIKQETEEKLKKQLESIPDQYKDLVLWLKDNLKIDVYQDEYDYTIESVKVWIGEVEIQ